MRSPLPSDRLPVARQGVPVRGDRARAERAAPSPLQVQQRAHQQAYCTAYRNVFEPEDPGVPIVRQENAKEYHGAYGEGPVPLASPALAAYVEATTTKGRISQ
jgi:hypothetical protein